MTARDLKLGFIVLAASFITSCGKKKDEAIFCLLGDNEVSILEKNNPVAEMLGNDNSEKKTIFFLADSSLVTVYNPGTAYATGGGQRWWRDGHFTADEKELYRKAAAYAKLHPAE